MGRHKKMSREQEKAMFAQMNQNRPRVYHLEKLNPSADYEPVPEVFRDKKAQEESLEEGETSVQGTPTKPEGSTRKKPVTRLLKTDDHIKVSVVVPSTEGNKPIKAEVYRARVSETEEYLRKMFGGSTSVKGFGTWKNPDTGEEYGEDVAVVETFTNAEDYRNHNDDLVKFVKAKKKDWRQQSVMVQMEDLQHHRSAEGAHYL